MRFGFSVALSLMVWLAVLFYWIETLYARLDGLHAAGDARSRDRQPGAGSSRATSTCSPTPPRRFRAHFVVAMLAYSLFTLAALHADADVRGRAQLHNARSPACSPACRPC
jgi:ABC-type uncharacterized transport system permease subunit